MLRTGLSETLDFGGEPLTEAPRTADPETRFEHYELVQREDGTPLELGRGAMGVTFKARDTNLERDVALKVVRAQYLSNEVVRQRFVTEARAAASLRHSNVASVYHLGKTGEDYFYAMEFVEGESLAGVLKYRGPLEVGLALEIVDQVAAALSAAYRKNIVHRDIKPSNLMLVFGDGARVTVKVIDFGLAKPIRAPTSEPRLSEAGMFLGTPHFASPEQCSGKEADIRSDLYSLGVTFWVMLTGKVPFDGRTLEVIEKHQHAAPPLEQLERVPNPVVSLIKSLLEKDPAKRPQTPFELQRMIQQVRESREIYSGGLLQGIQTPRKRPRFRMEQLILAIILIGGIAGACLYFAYWNPSHHTNAKSVAVLPFENVGEDRQQEYFGDGLTTEVIFQLSKIADLRVISRNSVMHYKSELRATGKTLDEIADELQVATILESSVQRLENRVKIVSILYEARTGERLWGASYDRELKDIFAIQTDVAENIAAALQVRLSAQQLAILEKKPTENLTAYDLYLRGVALWELRHKEDNEKAIALFKQALEQDGKFALGYVGLANAYIERAIRFNAEPFWLDSAIDLCQQAIAFDPGQARSYFVLARAFTMKNLPEQAQRAIKKGLELAPNDPEANLWAASQLPFTNPEAYAPLRKSNTLNPNDPRAPYLLGLMCAIFKENDLMERWMQRAIDLENDPERHRMIELERMIYRGDLRQAVEGLKKISPYLVSYGPSALDLLVGCLERLGDWAEVLRLSDAELKNPAYATWALFHEALALKGLGRQTQAAETMKQLLKTERDAFATNEKDIYAGIYLAFGNRLIGQKDDAYTYLRSVFPGLIDYLPLLWANAAFDLFADDAEYLAMISEFEKKSGAPGRERIRRIEREF
jgi:serine/threonine protein kinase/tetratricopeptide (TPR) repeat protein